MDGTIPPADSEVQARHRPRIRRPVRIRTRTPEDLRVAIHIDARTTVGKEVRKFRASLMEHVGNRPTATEAALIELAIQLRGRLAVMDFNFTERGYQSAHDARTYLAWAGALSRVLVKRGLAGRSPTATNLATYLAAQEPRAVQPAKAGPGRPRKAAGTKGAAPSSSALTPRPAPVASMRKRLPRALDGEVAEKSAP